MDGERKDTGGLAAIIAAGCLVVVLGVASLVAVGTYLEYRAALSQAKARQAAQRAQFQAIQARQQAQAAEAADAVTTSEP